MLFYSLRKRNLAISTSSTFMKDEAVFHFAEKERERERDHLGLKNTKSGVSNTISRLWLSQDGADDGCLGGSVRCVLSCFVC